MSADVVCAYLSQVVKPVTECEASADNDCGGRLRDNDAPRFVKNHEREDRATISVPRQDKAGDRRYRQTRRDV